MAESDVKLGTERATCRHQVFCGIGFIGPFLGVFVMMKSLLLGLLILVVSVWIGMRFAAKS